MLKIREFRFNETRLIWAVRFANSNKAKWTDKGEVGEVSIWLSIAAVLCNKGGFLLCPAPLSLTFSFSSSLFYLRDSLVIRPRRLRLYVSLFSVSAQTTFSASSLRALHHVRKVTDIVKDHFTPRLEDRLARP